MRVRARKLRCGPRVYLKAGLSKSPGAKFCGFALVGAVREGRAVVEARLFLDAMLEVAQESAEDLPAIGAAEFEVPLQVYTDDTVGMHAGSFEFVAVEFIWQHHGEELLASQFDEFHEGHRSLRKMQVPRPHGDGWVTAYRAGGED